SSASRSRSGIPQICCGGSWQRSSTIMLRGHWIEMRSIFQASGAIRELAKLLPSTAQRIVGERCRHDAQHAPYRSCVPAAADGGEAWTTWTLLRVCDLHQLVEVLRIASRKQSVPGVQHVLLIHVQRGEHRAREVDWRSRSGSDHAAIRDRPLFAIPRRAAIAWLVLEVLLRVARVRTIVEESAARKPARRAADGG